ADISTLSLHDALPISEMARQRRREGALSHAGWADQEEVHVLAALVDGPQATAVAIDRCAQVVDVVRAELLQQRVGEYEREHRLRSEEHTSELQSPYDL